MIDKKTLGIVAYSDNGWIHFEKNGWFPNILAGKENPTIMIRRDTFTICTRITDIDFSGGRIKINIPHTVIKGDMIWLV